MPDDELTQSGFKTAIAAYSTAPYNLRQVQLVQSPKPSEGLSPAPT